MAVANEVLHRPGLLLAAVGLYGVVAYTASQRRHEIGVRMALGANRGSILKMVIGQGLGLVGIGLGAGLAVSLALTSFMGAMFYQVEPSDPLTYAAVAGLLVGAALFASYMPARRASGVEVTSALRCE